MSLFIFLYKFIYPFCIFFLKIASPFHPKLSRFVKMRRKVKGKYPWDLPQMKGCILIHAASGEFEYAKPVIRELVRRNKKVLVTYYSPSYKDQIEAFPGITSCPLPWDSPRLMKSFLQAVQPDLILITRTDFWIHFLKEVQFLRIPVYLFSAVLSKSSSKVSNPFLRKYYSYIFSLLNRIYCVTEEDQKNFFIYFNHTHIEAVGDTRYDQVLHRVNHPQELKNHFIFENIGGERKKLGYVLVAGSTWPEDEAKIIKAAKNLVSSSVRIVIAPHEPTPEHIMSLRAKLKKQNVFSQLYSTETRWAPDHVLIIDKVGILADLYKWADWAFIGGSFKKQVHSVMEALAQGCYTFVGPYHHNNREALEFKKQIFFVKTKKIQAVQPFTKTQELMDAVLATKNFELLQEVRIKIQSELALLTGASDKLCDSILENEGLNNGH